jgi:hypothetical protein
VDIALFNESAHELFHGIGVAMEVTHALVTALHPLVRDSIRIGKPVNATRVGNFATDRTLCKHPGLDTNKRSGTPSLACQKKALENHRLNSCCQ